MVKSVITLAVALAIGSIGSAFAEQPSNARKLAMDVCEKCHGPNGSSASPLFPRLAGQTAEYLSTQLKIFRDQTRADSHARAYMWGIAGPLTDKQINELAAYYAKFPPVPGRASENPQLAAKGKALFEEGAPERDVPACAGCHGANGEGQEAFPRLAGQHYQYLVRELREFNGKQRESDIMDENAKALTEDDIIAIAEYLSGK